MKLVWTEDMQATIAKMAAEGKSASEAAAVVGLSRSAILGRAHRTGVKFHSKRQRPHSAKPRVYRTPEQRRAQASATMRDRWASGMMHGNTLPLSLRVAAVAAVLAGVSQYKAAKSFKVSVASVRNWLRNTAVVLAAKEIAERAREQAEAAAVERVKAAAEMAALERAARDRANALVLNQVDGRCRIFCEAYLAGKTMQEIGDAHGITRERVRQIMAPAIRLGLITSRKLRPSNGAYVPTGRRRGPRSRVNSGYAAVVAGGYA